ncbi:hypothetical protein [Ureibacillus chungkukjangi]|uniref:Uncharacterized protein n=1 Tax=Ureibacillus chungkukjangi TaxID=1202712 RepID=A0A318TW72_9BACL|nr:hypothetical protein [Ureibacillus chungkukjangi]MCM3390093.1 hypothetical protein [Ureibacillus chungkukjangi]PYF07238.1 hypothetical protein BJ095_10528 [Ureibacillus chungkukjangi]
MWVVTIFEEKTYRIFEFDTKEEATTALKKIEIPAILSYTNLTLIA